MSAPRVPSAVSRTEARLGVAAFLAVLWLPLVVAWLRPDAALSLTEQRTLAPLPDRPRSLAELRELPRRLERWLDDHVGLREDAIRAWAWLHIEGLGVSPSDKLVVGRDGWLFFGDANAVAQYRGVARFSEAELDAWVAALEERRDWLAARGTAFLTVLVPNKHRVYGQYMPESLAPVGTGSQLDQLVERLRARGGIPFLDLRPVLAEAARGARVYHRTDTHWNDLGAYAAYRAILAALARQDPALVPQPPVAVRPFERTTPGMGLARIVGLSRAYPERSLELRVEAPRATPTGDRRALVEERLRTQQPFGLGTGDDEQPTAVVFHDSFIEALVPFLSESFSRVNYFWQPDVIPSVVESVRPDVVVHQIAERFLGRPPRSLAEADAAMRRALKSR